MFTLGIIVLLIALLALVFNLRTSYKTQGGGIGQVPVFGSSVIQIPLLVMLGLNLINDATVRFHFPWWYYLVAWLVLVVIIGGLITLAGNCAKPGKS